MSFFPSTEVTSGADRLREAIQTAKPELVATSMRDMSKWLGAVGAVHDDMVDLARGTCKTVVNVAVTAGVLVVPGSGVLARVGIELLIALVLYQGAATGWVRGWRELSMCTSG